ncbi:L-ribulose-5-phosphate 4-epimerase [uncultured Dubosiella sp.]|uniref:L-ribulose-5-phosphate 4-epimerase n=1 Tax=uncultured Dubosiella sp. TaxID=1937011 RepID=UPI0025943E47|nr:L-ribulose-5-phosphate 4-epimerase [uncultured Dubosiella sp.]
MLDALKREVWKQNLRLRDLDLVLFTWGNVSAIERESGLVVIKPSGVAYETMRPEDMVVVDLNGHVVEGSLRPSSDLPTHLALYRADPSIGGIVHTHSTWATAFAQAGKDLPAFGTTHADYFRGSIPCTRAMRPDETKAEYEKNTGNVIVETFQARTIAMSDTPAVLVKNHGPFAWGKDADEAVYHAKVLEETAKMAAITTMVCPNAAPAPRHLIEKHFTRKHGPHAYYGQSR